MNTHLSKLLFLLSLLFFTAITRADIHICWKEPNPQSFQTPNAYFMASRLGSSTDGSAFANDHPYIFSKVNQNPEAYAVRVSGPYSISGASVNNDEKASQVSGSLFPVAPDASGSSQTANTTQIDLRYNSVQSINGAVSDANSGAVRNAAVYLPTFALMHVATV